MLPSTCTRHTVFLSLRVLSMFVSWPLDTSTGTRIESDVKTGAVQTSPSSYQTSACESPLFNWDRISSMRSGDIQRIQEGSNSSRAEGVTISGHRGSLVSIHFFSSIHSIPTTEHGMAELQIYAIRHDWTFFLPLAITPHRSTIPLEGQTAEVGGGPLVDIIIEV
jgi:hypothetical protein